jgi:Tol biopolymer transport system component
MAHLKGQFLRQATVAVVLALLFQLSGTALQGHPILRERTFPHSSYRVLSSLNPISEQDMPSFRRSPLDSGMLQDHLPDKSNPVSGSGKIVFSSGQDIFTINPDGRELRQLTSGVFGEINVQPVWSPDGSQIAFVSNRDGGDVEIYLMGAMGEKPQRLTYQEGEDSEPAWSPDGSKIAYVHGDDPSVNGYINSAPCHIPNIYLMSADGSNQVRLTEKGENTDPAWSPDGTRILFSNKQEGINFELYILNLIDGELLRLTHSLTAEAEPAWSPDGNSIAFISGNTDSLMECGVDGIIQNPSPFSASSGGDIYLLNLTNYDQKKLNARGGYNELAFSPDGTQLAVSYQDQGTDLYIFNLGSLTITSKLTSDGSFSSPSWVRGGL